MIKKFNLFNNISENKSQEKILFMYSFDWDDNLLHMPTVIHMDKLVDGEWIPVDISTADFAIVRNDKDNWRILDNDPEKAFSEFRDYGPRGDKAFLIDVKKAIQEGKKGPVWNDFIECLTNGSLFSIITARGHEPESIRKGIEWIIDNVLSENEKYTMYNNLLKFTYLFKTDEKEYDRIPKTDLSKTELVKNYLDECDFVGVSAPSRGGTPENPEKSKEEALLEFKAKINKYAQSIGYKAMIGFSDDDLKNVKHIEDLIDNINNEQFPHIIKYVVKGTTDPKNITKKVKDVVQESSHQTPGMESSIMPFTQFNNMTTRLYPADSTNRQNDYANKMQREVKFLTKNSEEILKDKKLKRKLKKK